MDNHWPNPLQLIELKDAVERRSTNVIIDDVHFTIRYDEKTFYVKPKNGFVPSGHFDYETTFAEIT